MSGAAQAALALPEAVTAHDPGGKHRWRIPADMRGGAHFCGPNDCYRTLLWREWGEPAAPAALWVGMNPSVADPIHDDPTVRKEISYTKRLGLTRYLKCNVSAYRSTDPKDLKPELVRCPENLATIVYHAHQAARVFVVFGKLSGPMLSLAHEVVRALDGIPLWCMGTNQDGSPRHPLYLPLAAEMLPWTGWNT